MRISDWSSDVCSSDLRTGFLIRPHSDVVDRHHVGPIEKIGDAAEALCLALRAVDAVRLVEPREMRVIRRRDQIGEHTSELQSLMRIPYAVFCLKKKKKTNMNA